MCIDPSKAIRLSALPSLRSQSLLTKRMRESIDFARFYSNASSGPTSGISFERLLQICSNVADRRITELGQLSSGEIRRVKAKLRKEKQWGGGIIVPPIWHGQLPNLIEAALTGPERP